MIRLNAVPKELSDSQPGDQAIAATLSNSTAAWLPENPTPPPDQEHLAAAVVDHHRISAGGGSQRREPPLRGTPSGATTRAGGR